MFRLVEVALSIRHDNVGSGFAGRCVNDRGRHPHVSAIARNYPSPVRGGNELQRNRFAGCHRMWAACRGAYRDELAYRTVAGTLSIFDLPKPHGSVAITVPIAREAKHLVRSERDHTRVPLK